MPRLKKSIEEPVNPFLNVPLAIFRDRTLTVLEAVVEYLKEHEKLTHHQIARLLNRDDRTIWTVYNRAKKKRS